MDLIQKMHLFIKEYQEVFVVIKLQHLSENAIKPHFIPFSLKNNSKKWLYTMPTDSNTSWDEFAMTFLKSVDYP